MKSFATKLPKPILGKVLIIGLGQMGASIAWQLKRRKIAQTVLGFNRHVAVSRKAKQLGYIDEISLDWRKTAQLADVIFVCTPIYVIESILAELKSLTKPTTIITDVGSSKTYLQTQAKKIGLSNYVPSHPMAGTEVAGIEGANADLFVGHWWFLTGGQALAKNKLKNILVAMGAKVQELKPRQHDELMVAISHLPHVLAYLIFHLPILNPVAKKLIYVGGSFRDLTRVANSSIEMWVDIFLSNRAAVLKGIAQLQNLLFNFTKLLQSGDPKKLFKFLKKSAELRKLL